jgi:hypothetical protein
MAATLRSRSRRRAPGDGAGATTPAADRSSRCCAPSPGSSCRKSTSRRSGHRGSFDDYATPSPIGTRSCRCWRPRSGDGAPSSRHPGPSRLLCARRCLNWTKRRGRHSVGRSRRSAMQRPVCATASLMDHWSHRSRTGRCLAQTCSSRCCGRASHRTHQSSCHRRVVWRDRVVTDCGGRLGTRRRTAGVAPTSTRVLGRG